MKKNILRIIILALIGSVTVFVGCSDTTKLGLTSQDNIPPSAPVIQTVRNTNGGAVIKYSVPLDDDLLYVTGRYNINGVEFAKQTSPYNDSIEVEGFGGDKEYQIELFSVDKSHNKSEVITVSINPLEPPVSIIYNSISMVPSFGGVKIYWSNPTEANIIVNVLLKDSIGDWVDLENFYSSAKNGFGTIRGLDTIPKTFGVQIRDRWDNYSKLLAKEEQPLYEVELDKAKFREISPTLPNDSPIWPGYPVSNIWDEVFNADNGFHSQGDAINKFITFDLGQEAKLSRYKLWERVDGGDDNMWLYNHNNMKRYNIYGCNEITADMRETGSIDGWTLLFEAETYKPSGDGPVTAEDKEYIRGGDEHEFPIENPSVRFIRIQLLESWSGGVMMQIGEMTFWGQIIEKEIDK